MNAAKTILVGGVLALSAFAAFMFWTGGGDGRAPGSTGGTITTVVPGWAAGDERAYALRVESSVDMTVGGGAGAGSVLQVLSGRLALRARDAHTLDAVLADAELAVGSRRDDLRSARMRAPFVVELGEDGAVVDCRFPGSSDDSVTGRLDELMRMFQVIGADSGTREWTATEQRRDGGYEAAYEWIDSRSLSKRRVRATASGGADIVSSAARVSVDDGPWVASFESEEELSMTLESGRARLVQRAFLTSLPEVEAVHAAFAASNRARVEERAVEQRAEAERLANERREPTADERAQLASLLQALTESEGRDVQAILELRDLLRSCPMLSGEIVEALRRDGLSGRVAAAAIHALELADHDPAHLALTAIFEDAAQDRLDRVRAIAALGGTSAPKPEVVERLWGLADARPGIDGDGERIDTARLSLGRLAQSMANDHPGRSAGITDRLSASLEVSADAARTSAALKALGNTRDPRGAPAVAARLDSPNPAVREAAALALVGLDPRAALPLLVDRLGLETVGRVREAIVEALIKIEDPDDAAVIAVARRAETEDHAGARRAMALYLAPRLAGRPELRTLLETMLRSEADDRARKALASALSAPRADDPR